jgi:hypothetical protein
MIVLVAEDIPADCFDVSTPEKQGKVALSILRSRFTGNIETPIPPVKPDFNDINSLPVSLRETASKQLLKYEESLFHYERTMRMLSQIQQCFENNDGELAWKILKKRSISYENEGMKIYVLRDEVRST